MIIRKALVVAVQQSDDQPATDETDETDGESDLTTAQTGGLVVTIATDDGAVERLVFAAEYGELWMARETEQTPETDGEAQTRRTVYGDAPSPLELTRLP